MIGSRLLAAGVVALACALAAAAAPTKPPAGVVSISTPGFPGAIAHGYGAVWVFSHRGGVIYRIDPRTTRVAARIGVNEAMCAAPAFGGGKVFVSGCSGLTGVAETYVVDPGTNAVVGRRTGAAPAYAAGSLWLVTSDEKTLLRTDPHSGVVLATIDPRIRPTAQQRVRPLGAAFGSLWVVSSYAVSRIDTNTNRVTAVIRLRGAQDSGPRPGGYLYGAKHAFVNGKLWVTNAAGVYVVDPASNTARRLHVKFSPYRELGDIWLTFARGKVWVRTGNRTIVGINPATGRVTARRPADPVGGGGGLDAAYGSLWVGNAGADTVWREKLR